MNLVWSLNSWKNEEENDYGYWNIAENEHLYKSHETW